ncbi:MAG: RsmG family class I SAM-dependent methyltransferase [[Clostridium] leptum]
MIDREKLKAYCEGFGVLLSPEQLDQFDGYCRLLLEWNKKMNLTAIREPEEVLIKHFVDSLALLGFAVGLPQGSEADRTWGREPDCGLPCNRRPAGFEAGCRWTA